MKINNIKGIGKNKKGILAPEVVKILIAVLCIVILLYLAFSLYGIFTQKSDLEKAKSILEAIKGKAEASDLVKTQYLILNLKDWSLLKIDNPSSCNGGVDDSCLCLCLSVKANDVDKNLQNIGLCKSNGVCVILNNFDITESYIDSNQHMTSNSIYFKDASFNIFLAKQSGKVLIYTSTTVSTETQTSQAGSKLTSLLDYKNPINPTNVRAEIISYIQKRSSANFGLLRTDLYAFLGDTKWKFEILDSSFKPYSTIDTYSITGEVNTLQEKISADGKDYYVKLTIPKTN